jgi:hypothetical protein
MERRFELVENERCQFIAPVQLRWTAADGKTYLASGQTVDASVYGLGLLVDQQILPDTEVTVWVGNTVVCGTGNVRYSHRIETGFRIGLQFQTTLVLQGVPEIDAVLMKALKPKAKERLRHFRHLRSLLKSVAAHVWFSNAASELIVAGAVGRAATVLSVEFVLDPNAQYNLQSAARSKGVKSII